ncbi:MAG: CTP synthase (glutamine hydrolyzing), partial [Parcubacteria group bacterium]|nr:CTP synthase (glutamine hydrolyzing) [Parcubacteria group bacterium]
MLQQKPKFIFIVGGVISGVGKGTAVSSIGLLLSRYGYRVSAVKIDPYLNIDAGTMNPTEHGEVFVTKDGLECDQDIGNYERFLDTEITRENYMTTGQIYLSVIERERNLGYNGKCVEAIPHLTQEIIDRFYRAIKKTSAEILIVEVGGTVGEYQNTIFLEAGRMLQLQYPDDVLWILVSYLPVPKKIGEMKTKPTQHAVRLLNSCGIQPHIILGRTPHPMDDVRKEKISVFCNVRKDDVISAPDVESIYDIPLNFAREQLGERIANKLNLPQKKLDISDWTAFVSKTKTTKKDVSIGIVGKYFSTGDFTLADSYISVIEAIKHASYAENTHPTIGWLNAEEYEKNPRALVELKKYDAIIVPGGFGNRGVEGKIAAIQFAREKQIPYLGLCYGMQLAVVEFARNICGFKDAHTTECDQHTPYPIIDLLPEQKQKIAQKEYGASMRLGDYLCMIMPKTRVFRVYNAVRDQWNMTKGKNDSIAINERHRHRYEINNDLFEPLAEKGMIIAGVNARELIEIIELKDHPFFIGTQFHPEFKSRPLRPHPLFSGLIK